MPVLYYFLLFAENYFNTLQKWLTTPPSLLSFIVRWSTIPNKKTSLVKFSTGLECNVFKTPRAGRQLKLFSFVVMYYKLWLLFFRKLRKTRKTRGKKCFLPYKRSSVKYCKSFTREKFKCNRSARTPRIYRTFRLNSWRFRTRFCFPVDHWSAVIACLTREEVNMGRGHRTFELDSSRHPPRSRTTVFTCVYFQVEHNNSWETTVNRLKDFVESRQHDEDWRERFSLIAVCSLAFPPATARDAVFTVEITSLLYTGRRPSTCQSTQRFTNISSAHSFLFFISIYTMFHVWYIIYIYKFLFYTVVGNKFCCCTVCSTLLRILFSPIFFFSILKIPNEAKYLLVSQWIYFILLLFQRSTTP